MGEEVARGGDMNADAGLDYARRGWPVVPLHHAVSFGPKRGVDRARCSCQNDDCESQGKHPRTTNGLHNATTDADVIRSWWQRWPNANLGLLTGVAFDVLDVDSEEALDALDALGDTICGGPISRTARGWHCLFAPTGHGNRSGLIPDVDWRGRYGYIVAPPSVHLSGVLYQWGRQGPDTPLEAPPAPILALLDPAKPTTVSRDGWETVRPPHAGRRWSGLVRTVEDAPEGERNGALNWAAFKVHGLIAAGTITVSEGITAADELEAAALRNGLGAVETRATIKSGLAGRRAGR
jgi:hypothetical protein